MMLYCWARNLGRGTVCGQLPCHTVPRACAVGYKNWSQIDHRSRRNGVNSIWGSYKGCMMTSVGRGLNRGVC